MKNWILSFRLKTLTASLAPVFVGTAVSFSIYNEWNFILCVWMLLSALCIQIGTNLFNDALDFKKGADTQKRLGFQRVTQSGLISYKKVMFMGFVFYFAALVFALPLVVHGGWPIVVLGLCSLLCGYIYTGGPYPLAYKGLGDIFVILFFGVFAVSGVVYLHTGEIGVASLIGGLQVGFLATTLLVINNMRDIQSDKKSNKKTLAVRFGLLFSRWEVLCLFFLSFAFHFYWIHIDKWPAVLLSSFVFPIVFHLVRRVWFSEPGTVYNAFLARASMIHFLFSGLLSVGLILS